VRHASGTTTAATPPSSSGSLGSSLGAAGDVTAAAARQTLCLDVHPSRPHLAATAGAGGCPVALWDLRAMACAASLVAVPHVSAAAAAGAGMPAPDVWEVRFDPAACGGVDGDGGRSAAAPSSSSSFATPLLFCTSDGGVWRAAFNPSAPAPSYYSAPAPPPPLTLLMREEGEAPVASFDVEPALGGDLVAASDECLMFRRRGGRGGMMMGGLLAEDVMGDGMAYDG
jgi:hypothetical protein